MMVWDLDTMKRLNDEAEKRGSTELSSAGWLINELTEAIDRGGFDLSLCGRCGKLVVCIPDGLPMCEGCAGDEHAEHKV